jgi:hypothetical protein
VFADVTPLVDVLWPTAGAAEPTASPTTTTDTTTAQLMTRRTRTIGESIPPVTSIPMFPPVSEKTSIAASRHDGASAPADQPAGELQIMQGL